MSERGSFVTEFIYCNRCLDIVKKHLLKNTKYLKGIQIPSYQDGKMLPIIAGKIGSLYPNGECDAIDEIISDISGKKETFEEELCHEIRISVLTDNGCNKTVIAYPPRV